MTMHRPTVSAIVITRDRPRLLADALISIERQTLAPVEVRIVDDGDVALDPSALPTTLLQVTLLPGGDRQSAASRNRAVHGGAGEVLAFLDDDDRWLPEHLARLGAAFEDPAVELAYTDAAVVRERVDDDGTRVELDRRDIARDWDPAMMRDNDFIPPSAMAVRRSAFEALGGFDTSFTYSEDWDFLLRAAKRRAPRRVPGVSAEIRMRETGNASADFNEERLACLERLAARHGLPRLEPRTFWEVAAIAAGARR